MGGPTKGKGKTAALWKGKGKGDGKGAWSEPREAKRIMVQIGPNSFEYQDNPKWTPPLTKGKSKGKGKGTFVTTYQLDKMVQAAVDKKTAAASKQPDTPDNKQSDGFTTVFTCDECGTEHHSWLPK